MQEYRKSLMYIIKLFTRNDVISTVQKLEVFCSGCVTSTFDDVLTHLVVSLWRDETFNLGIFGLKSHAPMVP